MMSRMKAVIEVTREDEWYVATDLVTQVADQGRTPEEAKANLVKGLRERYETLLELAPKRKDVEIVDVEA